jgi:hypothetical protein
MGPVFFLVLSVLAVQPTAAVESGIELKAKDGIGLYS